MSQTRRVTFAANNGPIGGGEVMLLAMARAARDAGWAVHVVGPDAQAGVLDAAAEEDFPTTRLAADRRRFMRELRAWDRSRVGLLWCNGLVPAMATAGRRSRVVHLHRLPEGLQRAAAVTARRGALATVVPSTFMAKHVPGARVMANWSAQVSAAPHVVAADRTRVGFIGRLGQDKGVHILAAAIDALVRQGLDAELVIAGEARFVEDGAADLVRAALARLGSRVTMLGWVAPAELFGRVDVLVVPSIWEEPFGLVATEAMSAGLPVVVTDAGALGEVMGEEYPWVARANDPADLSRIVELFLTTEESERSRVITRSYKRWEEHFSPRAGEKRFQDLLSHFAQGLS